MVCFLVLVPVAALGLPVNGEYLLYFLALVAAQHFVPKRTELLQFFRRNYRKYSLYCVV
jgi:hypothetical protein